MRVDMHVLVCVCMCACKSSVTKLCPRVFMTKEYFHQEVFRESHFVCERNRNKRKQIYKSLKGFTARKLNVFMFLFFSVCNTCCISCR